MGDSTDNPNGTVTDRVADLRSIAHDIAIAEERTASALANAAVIWERRLRDGWAPPAGGAFPWEMMRLSLAALVPGMKASGAWSERAGARTAGPSKVVALVLAGNTPLLSWSPIAAALLAGHSVFAKMSRDETLWPTLFRDVLAQVDPVVAARLVLDVWPGDDPRTAELVRAADAVVAFGSDRTLAALRDVTPPTMPFFGYGHGISIGLVPGGSPGGDHGFARDVLLYSQSGCLSPRAIFVEGSPDRARAFGAALASAMAGMARELVAPPVRDPAIAHAVREARDMAHFEGAASSGSADLSWTVITHQMPSPVLLLGEHGVVSVIPIGNAVCDLRPLLGESVGYVTGAGVAGTVAGELEVLLASLGVSRICPPGEMQTPPLDWPNGGRDLLADLCGI